MTPLSIYAMCAGATIRPHPATEPVPGDGGVVVVVPTDTWLDIDDLLADPRTDTTAAILVAPALQRPGFLPNVVATASIISPAVPIDGLFEAVVKSMEGAEADVPTPAMVAEGCRPGRGHGGFRRGGESSSVTSSCSVTRLRW